MITEKQRLNAAKKIVYLCDTQKDGKHAGILYGSWIDTVGIQRFTNAVVMVDTNKYIAGLPVIDTKKDKSWNWQEFNQSFSKILNILCKTKQYCEIPLSEAEIKRIGKEGQMNYYCDEPTRFVKYSDTWVMKWSLYLAVYALGGENIKVKYFMDENKDKLVILSENGTAVIAAYNGLEEGAE